MRKILSYFFFFFGVFSLGACLENGERPLQEKEMVKRAIINGAQDLTHPAIGALAQRSGNNSYRTFCTGTLITPRLIVTAAHCVESITPTNLASHAFRVDRPEADGTSFQTSYYEFEATHTHPRYGRGVPVREYSDYDIAVIVLKQPITDIPLLAINRKAVDQTWLGQDLKLVGYGLTQTQPQRISATSKQAADIPLDEIRPRSFRHWDRATKKSVCNGDSGGPALYNINGVLSILGVSSVVEGATPDPQTNLTFCDAAGVSTRIDTNLEFLDPFIRRYGSIAENCNDDAACGACGRCDGGSCEGVPLSQPAAQCKPCRQDSDCGAGGRCAFTESGFRCQQPCTETVCFQCPNDAVCAAFQGVGASAGLLCQSSQCPPVSCQSDADCGLADRCVNGTCRLERPTRTPELCRPCQSSADCGTGSCLGASTGLGYCVQGCGVGDLCPEGFACTQLTLGFKQCIPRQGCFMHCDDTLPCPNGYTCKEGFCHRDNGGLTGDFCKAGFACAIGLSCVDEDAGSGRCAPSCSPSGAVAGNACLSERRCAEGLTCNGNRSAACMRNCTATNQPCAEGGRCENVQQGITVCVCRRDSDCNADQFCNINRWTSLGLGGCVDKALAPPPCQDPLGCRSVGGGQLACLPEIGEQRTGTLCSRTLRCQDGLACYNFDGSPLCMEPCSSGVACKDGGFCANLGNGLQLCLCQNDQQCGQGRRCLLNLPDQGVGTCAPAPSSLCTADPDCPRSYRCQAGACIPLNTSPEVTPETTPEATPEVTPEAAPEGDASPEAAPELATEPPQDELTPEEATLEAAPVEKNPEPPITTGGCGCNSQREEPAIFFALLLLALFFLRRPTTRRSL